MRARQELSGPGPRHLGPRLTRFPDGRTLKARSEEDGGAKTYRARASAVCFRKAAFGITCES